MWWVAATWATSVTLLGEGGFRAPDGVADAAVLDDGSAWVLSPHGEVAGFDPEGALVTTFQACPDRAPRVEFTVSMRGNRLGLSCGDHFRVYDLPSGTLRQTFDVDTTDAALSMKGSHVGILGERFEGDVTEDQSWLLVFDVTTGKITRTFLGEWDRVEATFTGWLLAKGNDSGTELSLQGIVRRPSDVFLWTYEASAEDLKGGGWTPRRSMNVRQRGEVVCLQHTGGGTCLRTRDGRPARTWVATVDEPFRAPGPGNRVRNPGGKHVLEVLRSRLRPVGSGGWSLPVAVHGAAGSDRLIVVDQDGTVFDARTEQVIARTTGLAALSDNGRWLWVQQESASRLLDLTQPADPGVVLEPLEAAVVDDEGTVVGVRVDGAFRRLVQLAVGGDAVDLREMPRLFEVTALERHGDQLLVSHGQDELAVAVSLADGTSTEIAHSFRFGDAVQLVNGELVSSVAGAERALGGSELADDAIVRIAPAGKGFAELARDEPTLRLKSMDGQTISTVELPGRAHAAWASSGRVFVALRDGRVAVVDWP